MDGKVDTQRRRPLIAVPGRFSESASALRYKAIVNAHALIKGVYDAGGEPVTMLPAADPGTAEDALYEEVSRRLAFADAVLLPGGADIAAWRYGQETHAESDAGDELQDRFDLAVARYVVANKVPTLAVCRGMQILNVSLGGDLEQHLPTPHMNQIHTITLDETCSLTSSIARNPQVSCYHHQAVRNLGTGLIATAWAEDGTIEAFELKDADFWIHAVQWHPEDTVASDLAQQALLKEFIANIPLGQNRDR
jgi:putative glutamine amidotransferase